MKIPEKNLKLPFVQRHFFSIYFAVYVGLSLLFWLAVSQELASSTGVLSFVSLIADYVPMLNSIEKIPGANPKIRFFYAVLWSLMPLLLLYPWFLPIEKRILQEQRGSMPKVRGLVWGVLLFGSGLLMAFVWPVNPGSASRRDEVLTGDAFGTVFFGYIASSMALMFGLSLWGLLAFLKLRSTNSTIN